MFVQRAGPSFCLYTMRWALCVILSLGSLSHPAQTGNWFWASNDITGKGEAHATACDPSGNVFITGATHSGPNSFGSYVLPSSVLTGTFIVKYDPNGNTLWAKAADGNSSDHGWGITTDHLGNAVSVGDFTSTFITFDLITLTKSSGGSDSYIVKYDAAGNVLWAMNPACVGSDYAYAVCSDQYNNIYITGWFQSTNLTWGSTMITNTDPGTAQVYVLKLDPGGNVIWLKTFGGNGSDLVEGIAVDSANNVYVTGMTISASIIFAQDTLLSGPTSERAFLVKYDAAGNEVWGRVYGTGNDRGNSVATDGAGNIYMAGSFSSPVISFGSYTLSCDGYTDAYLVKVNPAGQVIWAMGSAGNGADLSSSVRTDTSGHVFLTGRYGFVQTDTIRFGSFQLPCPPGSVDPFFMVRLDTAGNVQCMTGLPTGGTAFPEIATDLNGSLLFGSASSISPLTVGSTTLTGNLGPYIMAAKWSCDLISEVFDGNERPDISVFPNPATDHFEIRSEHLFSRGTLEITDATGRIFKSRQDLYGDFFRFESDPLTPGLYFITIRDEDGIFTQKLQISGSH